MDTQRTFSLSTIAVSIVFIGLFAVSAFAADEKPRVWRHEGLLIDNRDVTFIQEHLDQEPWKSAWERQGPGVGYSIEYDGDLETLERTKHEIIWLKEMLRMGLLMAVEPNQERGESLAKQTSVFPEMFDQTIEELGSKLSTTERARAIALYAMGVEYARRVDGWAESELKKSQDWLRSKIDKLKSEEFTPVGSAWFSAACLAVGVVLEDDPLYQQGEKNYLDLLQAEFDDHGCLKTPLPLPEYVELVTGMIVTAEIANHHSDLFYGHDLYHESFGPKNMHQVCSCLFSLVLADAEGLYHWGWLELAAKTFGEPAWLEALRDRRPVFDVWTGGGVTLSHARWLGTGLPDFGMAEDGFHWLHNRKDLSCWQYSSRWYDINKADFYVEDGIFKTKGGRDHWLLTDRMYANFILRLEYKIGQGSNSGIMIWAPIPGRPSKTGFEVQLLDDAGQPPRKDGSGALYNVAPPIVNAQKPAGEWNELEIICDNPRLTVHMNGTLIQDLNLDDYPVTQGRRRRGYIGLQDHSHRVAFRNVRIKPLD